MVGLVLVILGYLATIIAVYLEYKAVPDKKRHTILGLRPGGFVLLLFAAASMLGGVWQYVEDLRDRAALKSVQYDSDRKLKEILEEVQNFRLASPNPEAAKQFQRIAEQLAAIAPEANGKNIEVIFIEPSAGEKVDFFTTVRYRVVGAIPVGYVPYLVVRDPVGQFWSWGKSSSGVHAGIQLGDLSDSGKEFEIGVLITNQEFPLNTPTRILPDGVYYQSILVRRR